MMQVRLYSPFFVSGSLILHFLFHLSFISFLFLLKFLISPMLLDLIYFLLLFVNFPHEVYFLQYFLQFLIFFDQVFLFYLLLFLPPLYLL